MGLILFVIFFMQKFSKTHFNNSGNSLDIKRKIQNIQELSQAQWLNSHELTTLRALINWKLFLAISQDKNSITNQNLLDYFDLFWYSNDKKLSAHAMRGYWIDDLVLEDLFFKIKSNQFSSNDFCALAPDEIKIIYPKLSISKIKLLQDFIKREKMFEWLDISKLSIQFPFPISKFNFFGRFIWWIRSNPQNWIRHLRSATPFFIQLKSMINILQQAEKNFLNMSNISNISKKEGFDDESFEVDGMKKSFLDIIISCIENSQDILDDKNSQKLTCIELPTLPLSICDNHIEKKEYNKLSLDIMNWIFFGDENSELLNRKSISISDKKLLKKLNNKISKLKNQIKTTKKQKDLAYENYESENTLKNENHCKNIENILDKLTSDLAETMISQKELKQKIVSAQSIVKKLKESKKDFSWDSLSDFREDIEQALSNWEKIVFVALDHWESILTRYFDRAFSQRKNNLSPGADLLKNCSFLMDDEFISWIDNYFCTNWSAINSNIRHFFFDTSTFNQSSIFITHSILPQKENLQISYLTNFILAKIPLAWITIKSHLDYSVSKFCWKKTPNISNYLEYAFEYSYLIEKSTILWLLNILNKLNYTQLPKRCIDIARERFHISSNIFNQFSCYSQNYRPNTLWVIPDTFENIATLRDYLDMWSDSYGMTKEVGYLEDALIKWNWIVWIVDSTNYHPEFFDEDCLWVDEEWDFENNNELLWKYIKPSDRLIKAFVWEVMEWRVWDSLKNYSLVSVKKPSWAKDPSILIINILFGTNINLSVNISKITSVMSDLYNYDEKTILIINAEYVENLEEYKELLNILEKFKFKVIIKLKEPLPWLNQVTIKPFLDSDIVSRIVLDQEPIRKKLWLEEAISSDLLSFAVNQVKIMRESSDDPLNIILKVIELAAQNARMHWYKNICQQDLSKAISSIFHLPDREQMKSRIEALDEFILNAPLEVLGQKAAIDSIWQKVKSHILWLRDPARPLTILLPWPTWVWKTEIMLKFAQAVNMPFFLIEWAEFSEEHTISRLVGSPNWYVWPDKGVLFKFLEDNNAWVVFIDEIEKMHPAVYTALMNFFDKATLTAWDWTIVRKPWFIIVWASNAWSDFLEKSMDINEIKNILSQSFIDRLWKPRPELVRRFDPILMLWIEKDEFRKVIELNLKSIWDRSWLVNSNISLVWIDSMAIDVLYDNCVSVCQYESSNIKMWFEQWAWEIKYSWESFYDMRHVSRALDSLIGDSLAEIVSEQIKSWDSHKRWLMKKIKLVWNKDYSSIKIVVVD